MLCSRKDAMRFKNSSLLRDLSNGRNEARQMSFKCCRECCVKAVGNKCCLALSTVDVAYV